MKCVQLSAQPVWTFNTTMWAECKSVGLHYLVKNKKDDPKSQTQTIRTCSVLDTNIRLKCFYGRIIQYLLMLSENLGTTLKTMNLTKLGWTPKKLIFKSFRILSFIKPPPDLKADINSESGGNKFQFEGKYF